MKNTDSIYFINVSDDSKFITSYTYKADSKEDLVSKIKELNETTSGYVVEQIYDESGKLIKAVYLGRFNGFTPSANECMNIESMLKYTPTVYGGFARQYKEE